MVEEARAHIQQSNVQAERPQFHAGLDAAVAVPPSVEGGEYVAMPNCRLTTASTPPAITLRRHADAILTLPE
jgi:hypothetical protein